MHFMYQVLKQAAEGKSELTILTPATMREALRAKGT